MSWERSELVIPPNAAISSSATRVSDGQTREGRRSWSHGSVAALRRAEPARQGDACSAARNTKHTAGRTYQSLIILPPLSSKNLQHLQPGALQCKYVWLWRWVPNFILQAIFFSKIRQIPKQFHLDSQACMTQNSFFSILTNCDFPFIYLLCYFFHQRICCMLCFLFVSPHKL